MTDKRVPIVTNLGQLHGRDCIFLDDVLFSPTEASLSLIGDINGSILEPPMPEEWIPYQLTFHGLLQYTKSPLDGSAWDWEASFERRFGSAFLAELDPNGRLGLSHYFVQTYDETFDIVCKSYELQFRGHKA